jgi:hypothetical protein
MSGCKTNHLEYPFSVGVRKCLRNVAPLTRSLPAARAAQLKMLMGRVEVLYRQIGLQVSVLVCERGDRSLQCMTTGLRTNCLAKRQDAFRLV